MRFQCPKCGGIVAVDDSDLGSQVQCGHCSNIVNVPSSRVAPGTLVADFIIRKELGRGGMGVVYLAYQISLDRPAALKVLSESYTNNAEFIVGFIKEARAAAKLNHPHIVQAYAVGEDEGVFYFAMENIDGETMKDVLQREKIIPVNQAINIIQQISEALNYAWLEQKLIHRDIKPDNIMLTSSGRAKLADLGLARTAGDIDDSEEEEVMGTPQYISPEHLTGAPMDGRSDIYSLGATFYHFVTGRFPFEGQNGAEIAQKHLTDPLIPPSEVNPDVPECVSRIIEKMMAKDPIMRYQDAEALVDDLRIAKKLIETNTCLIPGSKPKKTMFKKHGGVSTHTGELDVTGTNHAMESTSDRLFSDETVSSAIRAEKMRSRRPIVFGVGGVILLGVIGGVAWYMMMPKEKAPEKPAESRYTRQMNEILTYAKVNPRPASLKMIRQKCEAFLADFPGPETETDQAILPEFMALFARSEEAVLKKSRSDAAAKLSTAIAEEEQKLAAEEERKAAEAAAAAEAKRKKEAAAAEAKRKREAAAAEAKREKDALNARMNAYKAELPKAQRELLKTVFLNSINKKTERAIKAIEEWKTKYVDERAAQEPQLAAIGKPYGILAEQMILILKDLSEIHDLALSNDSKLEKVKVIIDGKVRTMDKIARGRLFYKDGMAEKAPKLSALSEETRNSLVEAAAKKLKKTDVLYFYFILSGNYAEAEKYVDKVTKPEHKAIMENTVLQTMCFDVMKEVYESLPEKQKRKFRKLYEGSK